MPYRSSRPELFIGYSVGSGQCVALVERAAHTPMTYHWHRGLRVKGNLDIPRGTAIATFDPDGRYGNHTDGRSHAAIYLGQGATGIQVIDQWINHRTGQKPVPQIGHERTIPFAAVQAHAVDDGDDYYVID